MAKIPPPHCTFADWIADLAEVLHKPVADLRQNPKLKKLYEKGFTPLAVKAKYQRSLQQKEVKPKTSA